MAVKALMTDETGKQIVDAIREKAGLEARVSDLEKNKVEKSSISQTTGDAEDKVMSQRAVTEELEKKFDKSNVVQSTGDAEDKVMSQAAATKEFGKLSEEIDDVHNGKIPLRIIENEYISSNVSNNGIPIKYNGWDRTDYTDCEGYDCLYIKSNKAIYSNNAFYDENKEFISLFSIEKANEFNKVNVPQNAKYFVLSGERSTVLSFVVKSKTGIVVEDFGLTTDIRRTKQTFTFNADGTPNKVTHTDAKGNVVRTDTFAYSGDTITETRVMATGATMKITLNTKTLTTEVE